MRKLRTPEMSDGLRKHLANNRSRRGSVELEAVLITAVMFPLATALYYLAGRAFTILYRMIAGILEWPYL